MNFVTKNLGWILLLLFFLFMLFVISSNDEKVLNTNTGAVTELTDTGALQEDLDSLVEMIDKDEVLSEPLETGEAIEQKMISDEVSLQEDKKGLFSFLGFGKDKKDEDQGDVAELIDEIQEAQEDSELEVDSQDVVDELIQEKQGFFSKLFGKDEEDTQEDVITSTGNTDIVTIVKGNTVNPRDNLIGIAGTGNDNTSMNMIKKSGTDQSLVYADTQKYAPEVLVNMYPGMNLETQIGKKFEIGVNALKLNNKYFNKTLGYMARGDVLTQLTTENSYGCFQVELTLSKQIGYVCKKYLKNTTQKIEAVATVEEAKEVIVVNTQIGDLITIEANEVMLGTTRLFVGDVIDQMSQGDENGCFSAHVYSSDSVERQGQIGRVCVTDLY